MGVVNMLGVFIFMLAGIIVGGLILIIEWIVATFKDIDKWNPEVRCVVCLDRFIPYQSLAFYPSGETSRCKGRGSVGV